MLCLYKAFTLQESRTARSMANVIGFGSAHVYNALLHFGEVNEQAGAVAEGIDYTSRR